MKLPPFIGKLALPLLAIAVLACSDSPVGPAGPAVDPFAEFGKGNGNGNGNNTGGTTDTGTTETTTTETTADNTLVDRKRPLAADVVATKVIGPNGGQIHMGKEGLELDIPYGALTEEVEITVTALAGDKIAFDMQPHGLQFNKPVAIWVAKKVGTTTEGVYGVYYDGNPNGAPTILEYFTAWENSSWVMFETTHFSGYALASGGRRSTTNSLDATF